MKKKNFVYILLLGLYGIVSHSGATKNTGNGACREEKIDAAFRLQGASIRLIISLLNSRIRNCFILEKKSFLNKIKYFFLVSPLILT